ncbi:MAG: hypothetical protein JW936_06245 [Sedimentisphaerales bacterium]|nr:hypothetical protein [Sedimentisphaerales bacterium]
MNMLWAMILAQAAEQEGGRTSFFSNFLEGAAWLGIVVVLAWVMLRNTRKRIAKSEARKGMTVQERVNEVRQSSVMVDRISELMSELADMSRRVNGELDTRTTKLEILLDEADRKITALQSALGREDDDVRLVDTFVHTDNSQEVGDVRSEIEATADRLEVDADPTENDAEAAVELDSPEHQRVWDLADQGLSAEQIARKVGRPTGEVQLIMALGRKKR